jgi:hypothetical protein
VSEAVVVAHSKEIGEHLTPAMVGAMKVDESVLFKLPDMEPGLATNILRSEAIRKLGRIASNYRLAMAPKRFVSYVTPYGLAFKREADSEVALNEYAVRWKSGGQDNERIVISMVSAVGVFSSLIEVADELTISADSNTYAQYKKAGL